MRKILVKAALSLAGLLLIPFCVAATLSVVSTLNAISVESFAAVPRSTWALVCGFCLWLSVWLCLPRPVRAYVLAHELTHALWGILTGKRVIAMKVGGKGGSVLLSGTNIFVTLAPYFFPLYTVLAIAVYYAVRPFVDLSPYELFWLALVGFTWGFHATFTAGALMEKQPDIFMYGRLLSYAFIYLFNVLGIGLWVVLVSSATFGDFGGALLAKTRLVWTFLYKAAGG